mmetsp:Transcript_67730/g.124652  ORF Transcript_67730/g.124652 Transcript_67730/m.124652 type:complete len:184 (-) Transcript_67730:51-602(-)
MRHWILFLGGVFLAPCGAKRLQVTQTIARDNAGVVQGVATSHTGSKAEAVQPDAEPTAAHSFSHVRNLASQMVDHKVGALVAVLLVFSAVTALMSLFQHSGKFSVTESEQKALIQSEQLAKDLRQKVGDKLSPTANGVPTPNAGIAPWAGSDKAVAAEEMTGEITSSSVTDSPEDTTSADSIA